MKPLKVDLPYPVIEPCCDFTSAKIIYPAYSGLKGELTATLSYTYHHLFFEKENDRETAELIKSIALCEMEHYNLLGKALISLGVNPLLLDKPSYLGEYYNASCVFTSHTAKKMLIDDISGELLAIDDYSKMLCRLKNEEVSALISRIRTDEELHVCALKNALNKY